MFFPPAGGMSDGSLINGVAYFVRSTKPTIRTDGSALVAGDRWFSADGTISAFWNSTFWLSSVEYATIDRAAAASATDPVSSVNVLDYNASTSAVFVTYVWAYRIPGGNALNGGDESNFFRFKWGYHVTGVTSFNSIVEKPNYLIPDPTHYREVVNTAVTITGFSMQRDLVGAGVTPGHRMGLNYRKIY